MKQFVRICVVLLALAGAARAQTYVAGIEDLPLMPGLTEQDGFVFEKAEGRIVEAVAVGAVKAQAVIEYYAHTLPQLGWVRAPDGSYIRDDERLVIAARETGTRVTVQFNLSPN
jgi:hypothetical protein